MTQELQITIHSESEAGLRNAKCVIADFLQRLVDENASTVVSVCVTNKKQDNP